MILGYEQPVDIPVMSIYDKDMMKMYIGALQKDYEQGLEDQKEFNKLAADFTSPIGKDNARWYNITTKPIKDYLDKNPNAIRSIEGRSWIRQFINSRPYGEMADLRQSANNAKLFDEARKKMMQDGTYSEDLTRYLKEDYSDWDTSKNGIFGNVSPTKYVGMEEALLPTIKMLQSSRRLDEKASNKRPGWLVYNVSEQQAKDAINQNYVDLIKLPSMQYHLKQSGLTEDQFKDLLAKQAHSQTGEELKYDQWAGLQAELAYKRAKDAADRKLAKELNEPQPDPVPLTAHQESDNMSSGKRTVHLGGGSNGGSPENFNKRMDEIISYYVNLRNTPYYKKNSKRVEANIKWATRVKKEGMKNAVKNGMFELNEHGDLIPTKGCIFYSRNRSENA